MRGLPRLSLLSALALWLLFQLRGDIPALVAARLPVTVVFLVWAAALTYVIARRVYGPFGAGRLLRAHPIEPEPSS